MPSLIKSFRVFKEGLDRRLFWKYWLEFKDKGWEVFWGPTLLGVCFGIYTLWHSPARPWFLSYVLAVVFLTGYYLWRVNHLRLEKKLEITNLIPSEWDLLPPDVHAGHKAKRYRLEIHNRSEGFTINNVAVKLQSISPPIEGVDWLPIHLHLKHDNPLAGRENVRSFNLNPQETQEVDFVSALEGDTEFSVVHAVPGVAHAIRFDTEGRRLEVIITAENEPPISAWFKVYRQESGKIQCEMET